MKRLIANNDLIINIIKKYFPDFVNNDYSESDMYKNINKIISDNHIQNISSFINTMKNYFEQCLKNGYCDSDIYNFIEELAEDNNINYNLFIQKVKECGNDYSTFTEDCCFSFANYLLDNNILSNDVGESESYDIAYCTVSEFFKDSSKYQTIFKSLFNECENRIKNKNKFSDAYEELSQVKDNIGDTIKTIQSYDNSSSRFVILNNNYLQDNCDDHMELFEKIANNLGYDNFQEFCEQNPNAQFITGKIENGIAIIETSSGKINANANINNVINILKKNGAKKVYTNKNKGRDNEFMRVAKRLIKLANEELYLKIKEFINTTMKSVTGKNLIQTKLIPAMLQANEEVSLKNAKQFMIDYEPFIAQRIKDIIDKYISKNSLDDVSGDVYDTFNAHLLDGYTESEFNNIYNSVKEKSEECYKELLNKKDKIGDEVTTSSSYDDSNTRFVYLNGKLKIKQSNDHGELFDDIAKEQGYTNSYEYSQDPKNKNAIFCSGKIEDGVAIIETTGNISNMDEIVSALKKNGAKKVYTNDNKIGNETKFKRVAKRLIKSEVEINEETITSAIKKYFNEKPNMKKTILRMETYVYLNKKCLGGKLIIYPEKSEFDDFILEHGCKENTHLFSLGNRIARKLNIPYEQKKQIYQIIDKCFTNCYSEEDLKKFCYPVLDEYSVDCYQQLLNNHDKIGETVTTSNGYDSQNNRFIYLNGKYLEGNCQDHMELFEQLSQKIGYDNFQQFCEQNPDAQFVTGKVKNGVAIIETSSGKVDANANINDVISVLKKNGIKKIYTNTNMGNDSEFKRVAKRLVKY